MINKNSKRDNVKISIKVPFGKNRKFAKTAFNINQIDEQILVARISALYKNSYSKSGAKYEKIGIKFTQFFYQSIKFCISWVLVIGKILLKLEEGCNCN